ncbi:MAG: ATP-binding protein [Candidatus Thorarchaeota archaeon]|jgi:signal transduction histidine kinase
MEDLSLHILDIAENAIRAGGKKIMIRLLEDQANDKLTLSVEDDGKGMDRETANKALGPFFTTKDHKTVGLGLALLSQAAQEAGGEFSVDSEEGKGTRVTAVFRLSHPDMKPIGDISATMAALVAGNPSTQFILDYRESGHSYYFDSCE